MHSDLEGPGLESLDLSNPISLEVSPLQAFLVILTA